MKSLKIAVLIVGAIALCPSTSFADAISGTTQEVNQESIVIGDRNTVRSDTRQTIINLQASGRSGTSISDISQRINAKTTIIGDGNTDVKSAIQANIDRQKSK
jgi:hypothetical protein